MSLLVYTDYVLRPALASSRYQADLRRAVADMAPPGASEADERATALRCWGLVHGLATLVLDQQISLDDAILERVIGGLAAGMRA